MGRKVEMKKIEDVTRCQVTYSKRRSSLMKKANEISVCCDVDVAFIAFSPSGRISKFSNQPRIEDVLERYINLSADKRYCHIKNLEEKLEWLNQLNYIKGDQNKLLHLHSKAEQIQLQITQARLELQMVEASLRDFEPATEQEPSLAQLLWCERNLKESLKRVVNKKKLLLGSFQSSFGQSNSLQVYGQIGMAEALGGTSSVTNDFSGKGQGPCTSHLLLQLDPWISPYSARIRETILQNLRSQAKEAPVNIPMSPSTYTTALQGMPGHDATCQFQKHSAETFGSHGDTLSIPINSESNYNIPMDANWFPGVNQGASHCLNALIQSTSSSQNFEPLFSTFGMAANNTTSYCNISEKPQAVLVQTDLPLQESPEGLILPMDPYVEAMTGTTSTSWAERSHNGCLWGGEGPEALVFPENLNFEGFDIPS